MKPFPAAAAGMPRRQEADGNKIRTFRAGNPAEQLTATKSEIMGSRNRKAIATKSELFRPVGLHQPCLTATKSELFRRLLPEEGHLGLLNRLRGSALVLIATKSEHRPFGLCKKPFLTRQKGRIGEKKHYWVLFFPFCFNKSNGLRFERAVD